MPSEEEQPLRVRFAYSPAGQWLRRQRAKVDHLEVRKARALARRVRSGPLDVLLLGDSTTAFTAPYDTDTRPLFQMIAEELGPETSMHAVFGASFKPAIHDAHVRQLEGHPPPGLVILPFAPRLSTLPWLEHPVHGHKNAIAFLSTVDGSTPIRRIRKGFPLPTQADFDRFHTLPHPTWAGDLLVGDYVRRLKGADFDDAETASLLYAYHYGGTVQPGAPLEASRRLGERLRRVGAPVVIYQTPTPVEKGVELHGPAFRELTEHNFRVLEDAFVEGYGEAVPVARTGLAMPTSHFIDWRDGSEHLNEHGRQAVLTALMDAVRAVRS